MNINLNILTNEAISSKKNVYLYIHRKVPIFFFTNIPKTFFNGYNKVLCTMKEM